MNKFFNMNSLFTRIILAVLSFAVIVCIFIPYMRIPAISSKQDVDVLNKTLDRNIGAEQNTFNMTEFTHATCPAYELYSDKELTQTVNKESIPLPEQENVYYFATYAYGYDVTGDMEKLEPVLLRVYTITFTKDSKNNSKTSLTRDVVAGTINVRVPKATSFDLTRVIDSKSAWLKQDTSMGQQFKEITNEKELKSVAIAKGDTAVFYAAITVKSEVDPNAWMTGVSEEESGTVYFPLDVYMVTVNRDAVKKTLPTVGEAGGGIMSAGLTAKAGEMSLSKDDTGMFIFMILGAACCILAFTVPDKFRIITLILGVLTGIGLIVTPVMDVMFYTKYSFVIDPGFYILIALGALLIFSAVFDFIRCRAEYRREMIHLYGEDYFSKERKAAIKAENKEKDAAYKAEKKAEREQAKVQKAQTKLNRKASE